MAVNWGLGVGNNALAMFQQGAQMGQQIREQRDREEYRKQQLDIQRKNAERQDAEFKAQQSERDAKAQEQARAKMGQMARFLAHAKDEQTYQQAKSAAGQYFGQDAIANAPANYDPNWVAQQRLIAEAIVKDGGQALSTAGKQAMDMGYQPGTPEFAQAVRDIWTAGESKPYVVGGETRLYQPKIGGQGQAIGSELPPGFKLDAPQGGQPAQGSGPFAP